MSDTIPPALTAEQWARRSKAVGQAGGAKTGVRVDNHPPMLSADWMQTMDSTQAAAGDQLIEFPGELLPAVIALANDALLDDDPRKITRGIVEGIRRRAEEYAGLDRVAQPGDWAGDASFFSALANALESYLPLSSTETP